MAKDLKFQYSLIPIHNTELNLTEVETRNNFGQKA